MKRIPITFPSLPVVKFRFPLVSPEVNVAYYLDIPAPSREEAEKEFERLVKGRTREP